MSIQSAHSIKNITGLSTDTKPTNYGIGAGSSFFETDTGVTYKYDGDSWFVSTSRDYLTDISRGKISGAKPFYAYGELTTAGAVTNRVVWPNGDWFAPPSAGVQLRVVSTSTEDSAAGTGARTIRLLVLFDDLSEGIIDVTMTGTTQVLTVETNVRFIQCAFITSYGSSKSTVGDISITNTADTETYSYIAADAMRCSSSARMVPAGKRLIINQMIGSSTSGTSAASTNIKIAVSKFEGFDYIDDSVLIPLGNLGFQDNSFGLSMKIPLAFDEGAVVAMIASPDKAATVSASWYGYLEDV